jgi:hypothetical protein
MTTMTLAEQMTDMTPAQQRRFLRGRARGGKAASPEQRQALSELQALRSLRDRLRVHFCSEPRLEDATDARCKPLPGVVCSCESCRKLKRIWPGVYLSGTSGISWECWLHANPDLWESLPPSSSIVRYK